MRYLSIVLYLAVLAFYLGLRSDALAGEFWCGVQPSGTIYCADDTKRLPRNLVGDIAVHLQGSLKDWHKYTHADTPRPRPLSICPTLSTYVCPAYKPRGGPKFEVGPEYRWGHGRHELSVRGRVGRKAVRLGRQGWRRCGI